MLHRRARRSLLAVASLLPWVAGAIPAYAFEVEPGSTGNTVYVLLRNLIPGTPFDSISIVNAPPAIVTGAAVSILPTEVPAQQSRLAAVTFDVPAGTDLGATGTLSIRFEGTASTQLLMIPVDVALVVVADAPEAQGEVGVGIPAPDPDGPDGDGDGVQDSHEVSYGKDPNDPDSVPGGVAGVAGIAVPMLGGAALVVLTLALLCSGQRVANRMGGVRT